MVYVSSLVHIYDGHCSAINAAASILTIACRCM
jgi:hypothetical protein